MLLWLILVALALWIVMFRIRRRRLYEYAAKLPSTGLAIPIFGDAHLLMGNTEEIMQSMQNFSRISIKNNGLAQAWLGHLLYVLMTDPKDIEVILKNCLEKDDVHRFMQNILGNGSIYAAVPIWRRKRKILVPAFSPKVVENFVEIFAEQSEKLTQQLRRRTDTGTFSIWPYINSYTLDSVGETVMGVKVNSQANSNSPFLLSINEILHLACQRMFHLWLQPDWLYKLFPQYKQHKECLQKIHSFTSDVIRKKREQIKFNETKNKVENEKKTRFDLDNYKNQTFLDLLIKFSGREEGFTDDELQDEVLTLTIAGTDTSAVAIGYTLALLAKYPDVQERVYQELYDVFEDSDRLLEKDDLQRLKYLDRVVKESLRLFPPVPFIIRKVLEEIRLPSGHILPVGAGVVVSIWGVQRDPKYWGPDADAFDPDRFLPERLNLHPCCYIPFSQGPRNCIGYQYALASVKTALSTILRRYRVEGEAESTSTPHIRVKLDVMMKAVDGYQVALEKRIPVSKNPKV